MTNSCDSDPFALDQRRQRGDLIVILKIVTGTSGLVPNGAYSEKHPLAHVVMRESLELRDKDR